MVDKTANNESPSSIFGGSGISFHLSVVVEKKVEKKMSCLGGDGDGDGGGLGGKKLLLSLLLLFKLKILNFLSMRLICFVYRYQ